MCRLQKLPKKQDCSKRRLKIRCMLPRLLHLALTSNSGNGEADLGVSAQLKELVLQYSRSLGVCVEDLGLWLSEIVTSSDYEVFTCPNHAHLRLYRTGASLMSVQFTAENVLKYTFSGGQC